ncbi:MAG TPA: glycine cleavage system aminomethyltransferase GcvT [candidate division Zixibacteria bacterium]|nr:glycine cleavage system aminomethyltransferase GcvT [candidate division Zixibacteria bacterium]
MTVTDTALKRTPFHRFHVEAGAKLVPFAGFEMPIQYDSMTAEHLAVRENVGLFDLSHMGEFTVCGADAEAFLQRVTCNDVGALAPGQIQYTAMLNERGGFVDDLLCYRTDNGYFLVVNASNIDKDFAWLQAHVSGDVTLANESDDYGLLAIQGPNAQAVAAQITDFNLDSIKYYHFALVDIDGVPTLVSRTGYTGEDGFEIYLRPAQAERVWGLVTRAGASHKLKLIGLGARDTLRLEMKMALYGNDMDENTTALEAGLSWIVKPDKGDFIGRDALERQKEDGITKRLVCIEFAERCIPRHGYPLVDSDGVESGVVTSGAFSPSLQKPIALGYLPSGQHKVGSPVSVKVRDKLFAGEVVKPPFYKHGSHR